MKLLITILLCSALNSVEVNLIKESGFPLVVHIPCTDIKSAQQITEVQNILADYLLAFGYKKMSPFGAESYFGPIDYVTENPKYPKFVNLSAGGQYNAQYNSVCITTKGDTKDGTYSGHSDKFACEISIFLSLKINTTRVNGAGKNEK